MIKEQSMENEPILKVTDLAYTYGNGQVGLKGVNLTICKGEKIAVLGSNGAGKSTFFLNINGVLTPEKGQISYQGTVINKKTLKELRKNIGIVFQDADNQIIASTVRAEVAFGPMNLKLPKEEVLNRVDQALNYMNMQDYKDRPPHYLSGGEKKRVSIADIIAMKPEVIIFDEPTAALDPINAQMLEEVLEKLSQEEKTMLISTHDVDFAYRWAQRIIVFAEGNIIADGSPLKIFKNREILEKANLTKPTLLTVYETLMENQLLPKGCQAPQSIDAFKALFKEHKIPDLEMVL